MNNVTLIGTIDSDFTVKKEDDRYRQKTVFAKFDLAVKRNGKNQGKSQFYDWIKCIAFGKEADKIINKYSRGTKVLIIGHIQSSELYYDAGDGDNPKEECKYFMNVVVDEAEFVGRNKLSEDSDDKCHEQIVKEESKYRNEDLVR